MALNLISGFRNDFFKNLLVIFAVKSYCFFECFMLLFGPLYIDFKRLFKDCEQVIVGVLAILTKSFTKCLSIAENLLSFLREN